MHFDPALLVHEAVKRLVLGTVLDPSRFHPSCPELVLQDILHDVHRREKVAQMMFDHLTLKRGGVDTDWRNAEAGTS